MADRTAEEMGAALDEQLPQIMEAGNEGQWQKALHMYDEALTLIVQIPCNTVDEAIALQGLLVQAISIRARMVNHWLEADHA